MRLCELLDASSIKIDLASRGKAEAIAELVDTLVEAGRLSDRQGVMDALLAREAVQTTGIGAAVAVPHAKHRSIKTLTAVLGTSRSGVEFDAVDRKPVRVVFLLVARADEPGPHVRALAEIARLLQVPGFFQKLTEARSPADLLAAIAAEEHASPGVGDRDVQETIQKMLQVEGQARQLVEQAEAEAKSLLVSSQQDLQRQMAEALQAARDQARQVLDSAVRQAQDEKQRQLQSQRQALGQTIRVSQEQIDAAAAEVRRAVLGL